MVGIWIPKGVVMKLARPFALLAVLLLFAAPAAAGNKGGVQMPDQLRVAGKTLVLNGMGIREATFLKVDVYVAGLYLEHRSANADAILGSAQVKHLMLHFVRDVSRKDIVKAWKEGFKKNAGSEGEALQPRLDRLNSMMSEMKDGQTLAFTFVPGKGTVVTIDGRGLGTVAGDDFSRVLLSIFIGPKPPNKGLKKGLLGRG